MNICQNETTTLQLNKLEKIIEDALNNSTSKIEKELKKKNINLTSMQINDYLWILGNEIPEKENYHLTRTIWY